MRTPTQFIFTGYKAQCCVRSSWNLSYRNTYYLQTAGILGYLIQNLIFEWKLDSLKAMFFFGIVSRLQVVFKVTSWFVSWIALWNIFKRPKKSTKNHQLLLKYCCLKKPSGRSQHWSSSGSLLIKSNKTVMTLINDVTNYIRNLLTIL